MLLQDICPVNTKFFVWDAVVAWRDGIYSSEGWSTTKSSSLINMLKLIEDDVINVRLELSHINDEWLRDCKCRVDKLPHLSETTKSIRKSCLNSLYKFIQDEFDQGVIPYQRHPKVAEIKHILSAPNGLDDLKSVIRQQLSSTQDKALTTVISPSKLCNVLSKTNERDAYIVWIMMYTGQRLESVLDIRKEQLRAPYLDIEGDSYHVPKHITGRLMELCKDSNIYLFETAAGKRVTRVQVTRNLKNVGHEIGLAFDLTPKVLHGYVIGYMSRDKRSELEKSFFPLFT